MTELNKAKELLKNSDYTCVLCKEQTVHTSTERGIKPLVRWVESANDFSAFCAADKVVGKGAAFLYVLLKVKAVYAAVISNSALQLLKANNIYVEYDKVVENIINRKGNGICPFEAAVLKTEDINTAYIAIRQKMIEMNIIL